MWSGKLLAFAFNLPPNSIYMKYFFLNPLFVFSSVIALLYSCNSELPVDFVDPFICTEGDHGQWLPAALVPFGLVELCPDTWPGSLTADGDYAHSGYDFSDNQIRGFSHFHRGSSGGTTVGERSGLVSLIPFTGTPEDEFFLNPVLDIDKNTEKAEAGYYSVNIAKDNIFAELTATHHTGIHLYTFNGNRGNKIFLYEGNRAGTGISCSVINGDRIEGSVGNKFFVIRFSSPVTKVKVWDGEQFNTETFLEKNDDGGIICEFGELKNNSLMVKVGVSLTSVEAARKNMEAECPHWDFKRVRREAKESWNKILSTVIVEGNNDDDKTIFYTALYHCFFLPVIQSDADGTYPGLDQKLHEADGYNHYDGYAFWDSFRTKYPLYSLLIPDIYDDIVTSLRDLYEQADNWGSLPESDHPPHGVIYKAAGKNGYQIFASCRHEHMLMVVSDAYFKGLMSTDIKPVYKYMRKEALLQMPEKYDSIGYIPARPDQTGEYCWDSWCLAQVARDIGNSSDYDYFMKRSEYWKNTWDSTLQFFRARSADGTWLDFPEDPAVNREKYTYEGSKWHWRWNVLHDVPSLIDLFHGKDRFIKELEFFFENDLYTAGNQIDLHAPFLFNMAGAPWLTQKWVRKILTEPIIQKYGTHNFFEEPVFDRVYKTTPDGYLAEMDDDYGCMAAWYAMSAMGLYQICPGNPIYQLTAPIFDEVTINLDNSIYKGKKFTIRALNLNNDNIYIRSATLNSKILTRSFLTHEEIVNGGELVIEMGNEPNKDWGI
jgi:predicted alpha-1,2-mannosidase